MSSIINPLRELLKQNPLNWEVRLDLADQLLADGAERQAAVLISTAPREPAEAIHLTRAARRLLSLDPSLAIRYTDAALAQDQSDAETALVRAEAHRARNEPSEAHRFFVVATALDPTSRDRGAELMDWLQSRDFCTPNPHPVPPRKSPDRHFANSTRVISTPREVDPEPVIFSVDLDEPILAVADEDNEPESVLLEPELPPVRIVGLRPPPQREVEPSLVQIVPDEPAETVVRPEISPTIQIDSDTALDSPLLSSPAQRKLLAPKASAAVIAVAVHAALLLLLGVLVIVVPQPPVAELVGIVSPELTQEQPETKKVVPAAMSAPTVVAASTSRAISATGVSAVALPEFDAKGTLDAVPEIASTDLGASFALPFSPKGTSAVNFFGIKSKGRRVAFLIDAERYILTDPRGGYPAYQIVKEEIAGMIGKLGLETMFNVVLYEGRNISAFSERLLPATAANKTKVGDWLYPVNREFEKLGLTTIKYPIQTLKAEVEPVKNDYITGYLRAIQYALECDVDAVFVVSSGYRSMEIPRTKEEREKILKEMKWTEKDDIAWREAIKKGQDWLAKENASRKSKGVPERVIVNIGEVWRDMGFRPPRSPPGGIQITAEEREDQIKNAVRLHYLATGKPKPQINFVIFIGKDQDKDTVPQLEHFENIAQRARGGKVRVLEGMAALKNVTGRK